MRSSFLFLLIFLLPWLCAAQDCTLARYRQLLREADEAAFGKKPDYQLAVNKLLSAQTCQPDSEAVVDLRLVKVFEEVNRQKELAIRNEREAKKQEGLAKKSAEEANMQRKRAEAQRDSTETQRRIAVEQRLHAEKTVRAARNAALFQDKKDNDPTLALRVAQYNLWKHPDDPNSAPNHIDIIKDSTAAFCRKVLTHQDAVDDVALSPDGRYLATAGEAINVWETSVWKKIFELVGSNITAIAFSPDGKYLAAASDHTAIVWETDGWIEAAVLTGHRSNVHAITFSTDGNQIATGSGDGTVIIWTIGTWATEHILEGRTEWISSVAFSADGRHFAAGAQDGSVIIWDAGSWKRMTDLAAYPNGILCVAFSADGRYLAAGGTGTVKMWEVGTWKEMPALTGHTADINSIAFSPDSKYLAAGGVDQKAIIWEIGTGKAVADFMPLNAEIMSVAWSHDGQYLAIGSYDFATHIYRPFEDCIECHAYEYSLAELRTAGVNLEPEELLPLWEQGEKLTPEELRYISKTANKNK